MVNIAKKAITGDRWKNDEKKYYLVAALDIKNAVYSAKWDCITDALEKMNVPGYLQKMVVNYFTDRILKYDPVSRLIK